MNLIELLAKREFQYDDLTKEKTKKYFDTKNPIPEEKSLELQRIVFVKTLTN